jgi:hypothetical protein
VVIACALACVLTACEAEDGPDTGETSASTELSATATDATQRAKIVVLPRQILGEAQGLAEVPTTFPVRIDQLQSLPFDGSDSTFVLAYRPYERLSDGVGWASEEAVLSSDGTWFRIPFETLELPTNLWLGPDTVGPGRLNSAGDRLLLAAARGVIVLDLQSGEVTPLLQSAGRLGLTQWGAGSDVIYASATEVPGDYRAEVASGKVHGFEVPGPALGFSPSGAPCAATSQVRGQVLVDCASGGSPERLRLAVSSAKPGYQYQTWSSAPYIAVRRLGDRTVQVFDRKEGLSVGVLKASRRAAAYLTIHGWIADRRLLFSMSGYLVTWDPKTGVLTKIASLPTSDIGGAHGSVGLTFRPLPTR